MELTQTEIAELCDNVHEYLSWACYGEELDPEMTAVRNRINSLLNKLNPNYRVIDLTINPSD